jgi:predicted Zn-dependent protease with MMP-like domain
MEKAEFERLVLGVLEELPDFFKEKLRNLEIIVEEVPPRQTGLLGLYHGVPLKRRGVFYGNILPDKITLYKTNIERIARHRREPLEDWIRRVLFHEIGHHLGFDEESIRRLT